MTIGATQSAGRPNGRQPPSSRLDTSKYCPSVMMNATPRVIPIMPSVAMNGGSLTTTISAALSKPGAEADQDADGHRRPQRPVRARRRARAATTPASAITAPGARSMPPEMMTIAAPIAAMP